MDIDWIGREVVHPKSHVAFLVEVGVFLHHLGMEQLGKVSLKALIVWPASIMFMEYSVHAMECITEAVCLLGVELAPVEDKKQ